MKLILLSGGSGKRLWPLSNDSRSKQFLKILEDSNGQLQSMVQKVWKQLGSVGLTEDTIIATSKAQVDMIQSQLNIQNKLVIEPSRRDTFAAIALACSFLHTVQSVDQEEVVVVLPVDPFVEDEFFERIKNLEDVININESNLALIGVKPTYPSSKYGYIVPVEDNNKSDYLKVLNFFEKPSEIKAKDLIEKGSLWNCGVFAFKMRYLLEILQDKGYSTNYYGLLEQYNELPKISFDYEVVEKTNNIVVLPYQGYWKDLGTWNTLTEEMKERHIGKGIISEDSENTHLINELDIPITILGLSNIVVAASPDGILVTDKTASPRIKELINGYNNRPMFEERRWGWYRVLDYTKFENNNEVLTKRIGVNAGKNLSYQLHHHRSEVWTIIKGNGLFVQNGAIREVFPGDVLEINIGDEHGIKAVTDLEFIEVQSGTELIEEDIVRIYMTWEEVEEYCSNKLNINY